jgi:hypothetical protein
MRRLKLRRVVRPMASKATRATSDTTMAVVVAAVLASAAIWAYFLPSSPL